MRSHERRVSELFEAIDLDGSGEVDLGEFCEMIVMLNNTTDYLGRLPCHRPVARAVASQVNANTCTKAHAGVHRHTQAIFARVRDRLHVCKRLETGGQMLSAWRQHVCVQVIRFHK